MTDKMRCVFCGSELENDLNMWDAPTDFWYCPNEKCVAPEQDINVKVWQALIDGKKAQDALKEIENLLHSSFIREQEEGFMVNWDVVAKIIKEKIASITKGDKK